MGWGLAAYGALNYLSSKEQSKAANQASQPLPTYYQYTQSPEQQQMWQTLYPTIQSMQGGPTSGWYSGLDENVRSGIEEPYMKAMDMMRNQLGGTGMLGNQSAGMSGAAADVFGQYMQKAAPTMAQTGWDMMMQPYQGAMSMIPTTYSDMLVGNTPNISEVGTGMAMPTNIYEALLQQILSKLKNNSDWGLGTEGNLGGYGMGFGSGGQGAIGLGGYGGEGGGYGW
jgi:hypothetical protein